MKETKNVIIHINTEEMDEKVEVTIKKKLSLQERAQLVTAAADIIADNDENNNFSYRPYAKQFAGKSQIIAMFTNVLEVCEINNYTDFLWDIINETETINLYDEIIEFVGYEAIDSIWFEIDDLVNYKVSQHNITSKHDVLLESLIDLIRAISNEVPSIKLEGIVNKDQLETEEKNTKK